MSSTSTRSALASVAAIAIGIAGLIHLAIVPQHYGHAPAHGIFFLVAGLIEIVWSIVYCRTPSRRLLHIGIGLGSMLLVLWLLTRSLPVPFGHEAEPMDAWAVVCKLSELVGVAALAVLALQTLGEGPSRPVNARALGFALSLGAASALATYVSARAAEPFLPTLIAIEEDHSHETGDEVHQEHEQPEGASEPTYAP